MPPAKTASSKREALTLTQLASYDDVLTDALVDHAYYWAIIPKNRSSYHPSRGVREAEITKIIQSEIVVNKDIDAAERRILTTDGLRKFMNGLKSDKQRLDFKAHLRRYLQIYLPDCPFEVNSTNRYTIVSHEAAITARRFIKRNETIKYLAGVQVVITPEEELEMTARKKDFSIIISSRNKCSSLFMGPARFANHDCNANAKLMTTGQAGIEIIATTNIDVGEEITVTYADSYFGENNCECLCRTCEDRRVNGWANDEIQSPTQVKRSIESESLQGYSLRRRRRDDSVDRQSRTPSITPGLRPRIYKSRPSRKSVRSGSDESPVDETTTENCSPMAASSASRKRPLEGPMMTPPFTPPKKLKISDDCSVPMPLTLDDSRSTSAQSARSSASVSSGDNGCSTDITEPEKESPGPDILSPKPDHAPMEIPVLKHEDSEDVSRAVLGGMEMFPPTAASPEASPAAYTEGRFSLSTPMQPHSTTTVPVSSLCNPGSPDSTNVSAPPDLPAGIIPSTESSTSASDTAAVDAQTQTLAQDEALDKEILSLQADANQPGKKRKYQRRVFVKETTPAASRRSPGDYTLTPLLLSEPEAAWIRCMNCETAFVQRNAYYTKSSCPRCERHSKLYGYVWPKTDKQGPGDREERILDHRTIHRYLGAEDEAKIRGRKRAVPVAAAKAGDAMQEAGPPKKRGRKPRGFKVVDDDDANWGPGRRSSTRRGRNMSRVI